MFEVLASAQEVAAKSLHVKIDGDAVNRFSGQLLSKGIMPKAWESQYHFHGGNEQTVFYLLVLDALNFCFWARQGTPKWEIPYGSGWLSGYHALSVSLKKALESGIPLTNADYLASLTMNQLRCILGGRGELQLMSERLQNLRELGQLLLREYHGHACDLVQQSSGSAVELARLLSEKLSSFRDVAEYQGGRVFFYKRGQIFAADLHGALGGKEWGSFRDMVELTAFADYKLPQVMRHLGILRYGHQLGEKVDQMVLLDPGSPEEVEIRANTIWAVELIRQDLGRRGNRLRAFEIDWLLWNLGQEDEFRAKPYHRTVTIFY